MKKIGVVAIVILIVCGGYWYYRKVQFAKQEVIPVQTNEVVPFKTGDIIFQTSQSSQSKAIQLATHSEISHCGIIVDANGNGGFFVFEAVGGMKITGLQQWIESGKDGKFAVKRLKNGDQILGTTGQEKMKAAASTIGNKPYDPYFEWSDDKIYCSELVYKIFQRGLNVELGEMRKLKDFDLTSPEVKALMKERYKSSIPLEEPVIAPIDIFNSQALITVHDDFNSK